MVFLIKLTNITRKVSTRTQDTDQLGVYVDCSLDCTAGNALSYGKLSSSSNDRVSDALVEDVVIPRDFGIANRSAHDLDGLFKVGAVRGLS